jgi:hypothetical protein
METELQPQVFIQHIHQYKPLSDDDTLVYDKVDER